MTAAAFLIAAALLGHAHAVVELSCSDNATCIENMAKEFVRSVRAQKTVRLFDSLTVEPLDTRQARSSEGPIASFLKSHAFSFDWNDFTFRLLKDQKVNNALDFEVYNSRSAKDVSEEVPKKSKSKVEEEEDDADKLTPKRRIAKRRQKKKLMQAVIPFVFGMKSAAAVILGLFVVTVLTLKAFVASKLAILVTVGMAVKKLYESYSLGAGLHNPYLYSQYPIDFPSASSHAYSVSGVSHFPEMYNPTALAHQQTELLPHNDASAQQSQQAPTVQLLNSTRASERWDGKSKLQKLLEPIVDGIRSYVDPIANMFYSMPATFRGLNSDVSTTNTTEEVIEQMKKPREILIPQPRNIAQRKISYKKSYRTRPKKYTELKIDLDKLKNNKDFYEYIKTKKYKHNYQNTYYYPRVKYFVNPNSFVVKPKYARLVPYRKGASANISLVAPIKTAATNVKDTWKPVVLFPIPIFNASFSHHNMTSMKPVQNFPQTNNRVRNRVKRNLDDKNYKLVTFANSGKSYIDSLLGRGAGIMHFVQTMVDADPITDMVNKASTYTKKVIKNSLKSNAPPRYYSIAYEFLMLTLDVIDGLVQVHEAIDNEFFSEFKHFKKKLHAKPSKPAKKKPAKGQKNKKKKKKPETQNQDEVW